VFVDKASGKLTSRPELDKALMVTRSGDQLVVTKLDRLGRSLEHLISLSKGLQERGVDLVVLDQGIDPSAAMGRMFFQILGAIAEFEHALMSERTMDGLAAARARGRTGGQKPKLTPRQARIAQAMYDGPARTASAATPRRRSPPSSASPALPSTGTSIVNVWYRRCHMARLGLATAAFGAITVTDSPCCRGALAGLDPRPLEDQPDVPPGLAQDRGTGAAAHPLQRSWR
jgi:resolvase-like protein